MKKALALVLSLVLMILPLSAVFAFAEGEEAGDGATVAGYTLDPETQTFTVNTPEGLNAVASLINGSDYETYKTYNITLANDLVFEKEEGVKNFTPIGGNNKPYSGTIDGAGHTLKGLQTDAGTVGSANRYRALVGIAGDGCTVKNLTIDDSTFTGLEYVSAVIGAAAGAVTVTDVHVKNTVIQGNADSGNNVGGLCGRFFQAAAGNALFANCTVEATMSAAKNVAGICGGEAANSDAEKPLKITIRNCLVAGTYETKLNASGSGTGGIFGFANGNSLITIENSVSIAELIAASGEAGSMLSMIRRSDYVIKNSIGYGAMIGFILLEDGDAPVTTSIDSTSAVVDPKKEASVDTVTLWGKAPTKEPAERYTLTIGDTPKTFIDATTPLIDMDTAKVRVAAMYTDEDFKAMALAFVNDNVPHVHVFDRKDTSAKYTKISPTCQIKGVYYYSCSICGLAGTETFEGETGEHRFASGWSTSATEHWHICLDCNEEKRDVAAHTFGEWTVKREATEKRDGEKERTCSVCGYKETEKIPKLAPATTTAAPTTQASAEDTAKKKGCGSTIGAGVGVILTVAFAGSLALRKRKEEK